MEDIKIKKIIGRPRKYNTKEESKAANLIAAKKYYKKVNSNEDILNRKIARLIKSANDAGFDIEIKYEKKKEE
jgi:Txe/YoeB family toxin of Txe-Axe toxin-antitoxin module